MSNKRLRTRRELKISSVELIPLHFYLCVSCVAETCDLKWCEDRATAVICYFNC